MKYITNCRVIMPDSIIEGKALAYDGAIHGLVEADEAIGEVIDAQGLYVSPGFVDVHIHGYLGADSSDGDEAGLRTIAEGIAKHGTLSFLPTTMTIPAPGLEKAFNAARSLRSASRTWSGAEILGIHAEGPYLNRAKKGAQNESSIQKPNAQFVISNSDIVRMVSLAPETEGGLDTVREICAKCGTVVSIGHSDADFETSLEAIKLGAGHITHLFNAMSPLSHRAPGVVGAALSTDAYCELIADTLHVHPGLYDLLCRIKGDRLILISDCTRAGGMPDGTYDLGDQEIFVSGIECRLADGTIAGSVLTLDTAVRNIIAHTGIPLHRAVAMASLYPARSIGAESKGMLLPGADADIILFDDEINIKHAVKCGKQIF